MTIPTKTATTEFIAGKLDELLETTITQEHFIVLKVDIQRLLANLADLDPTFQDVAVTWRKLGINGTLSNYMSAIADLKALIS